VSIAVKILENNCEGHTQSIQQNNQLIATFKQLQGYHTKISTIKRYIK